MDNRLAHPARIGVRRYWFGPEVEGVLSADQLHTVFIPNFLRADEWARVLAEPHLRQVFLTETFLDWQWFSTVWQDIAEKGYVVTKGVMLQDVPAFLRVRESAPWGGSVSMIVRVFGAPWCAALKPGDQISVGVPYAMVTMSVGHGVVTRPDQYMKDVAP